VENGVYLCCPNCGFDNPGGMNVCGRCGTKLSHRCPQCGFENPPGFAFCGNYGRPLTGQTPAPSPTQTGMAGAKPQEQAAQVRPPAAELRAPDAERRQLTVLFCDLVDSTVLASQLDPEAWREVVRVYQATCAEVIDRYEGHIAQYLGDGLLVYFGYPRAHEDDAPRAVRAGLGMVEALGQLNPRLAQERGVHLAVRLGVHTGLVVVGEIGGGAKLEQLAFGGTPNVAARLQGLAAPNTVVISAATYRPLEEFFSCQPLGTPALKGVGQPLEIYQVLYESMARSRLEAAGRTGLTPLVGRGQEVALLRERWEQVRVSDTRPTTCSRRSMAGSPKALRPPTSRRPRRCSRSCPEPFRHRHTPSRPGHV
jgi:class 3 adenylate cyclase